MAWYDFITQWNDSSDESVVERPPEGSYADVDPKAAKTWDTLNNAIQRMGATEELTLVKAMLEEKARAPSVSIGIPDVGFKGVRQQLFQRFNLIDLYAIAHNNSVLKTAIGNLKQEVFRRGLKWEPAFDYRHMETGIDYTLEELRKLKEEDEGAHNALLLMLEKPDQTQRIRFEELMQDSNIYGQSLMKLMHIVEDDLNITDDGFLFLSFQYDFGWVDGRERVESKVRQIFRLDPVFMEFDIDKENRPGFAHHICLLHREDLLDIPEDQGWEHEWKGRCPIDGYTTYPVLYRYTPYRGTFGVNAGEQGPNPRSLYLVKGEVIHVSKFSPSELYGYSPVLSIYEKALSLIGMDRYLYDYFFERQIPQGVITTVTDNPEGLEARKEQMLSEMMNNPHYIPWLAVSSKAGQGKTEFTRFAYSLDELDFLPVQEHIERSVASLYNIPGLFMGYEDGVGGLNNESQQVTRLSRGAQLSQSVYNTSVLPVLLDAFGITDWELSLETAEESSEKFKIEIMQQKAAWAQTLAGIGFGIKYNQDTDEYEIFGEVDPMSEQQEMGMGEETMGEEGGMMEGEEGGEGGEGEEVPDEWLDEEGNEYPRWD